MPHRSWLCAAALALMVCSLAYAQEQSASDDQPRQEEGAPNSNTRRPNQQSSAPDIQPALQAIEAALRDLKREVDDAEEERSRDQARRELNAQEEVAMWAGPMFYAAAATVLLTFVALAAIIRTLHHTRRAADSAEKMTIEAREATIAALAAVRATEEIGQRQLRAYVTVDIRKGILLTPEKNALRIHIRFVNMGQTPAKNVRNVSSYGILPYRPPMGCIPPPTDVGEATGSRSTMANGGDLVVNKVVPIPPRDFLMEMIGRNEMIHMWGTIFYEDVFDRTQQTNFFFWIRNEKIIEAIDQPIVGTGEPIAIDGSGFTRANQWNDMT